MNKLSLEFFNATINSYLYNIKASKSEYSSRHHLTLAR